jgi:hypothetical protein
MTSQNPMLTLVAVPCMRCGSTAETVMRDREVLGTADGVCCTPSAPSVECWFCGSEAPRPFWLGKRPFCGRSCAAGWAE